MSEKQLRPTRLGAVLYVAGLVSLAALAFGASWPDMEAGVFDPATTLVAREGLPGFSCPLAIGADEESAVRAAFRNPTGSRVSFLVRSRIAEGHVTLYREDRRVVSLGAGEGAELSWPVAATDAVYGRLVMARVLATSSASAPARQSACGVLVLGVPTPDAHLTFLAAVLVAGALVLSGGGLWLSPRRPLTPRDLSRARYVALLTVVVAASLLAGLLGAWLVSHLLLVLALLLLVATLESVR